MVKELKEAVAEAEMLTPEEQVRIAKVIRDEMSWDDSFKNSQSQLSQLADEAIQDFKSGKVHKGNW